MKIVQVQNKRTGVVSPMSEKQALFLVRYGSCEIVEEAKAEKKTYYTKDLKAETVENVAVQSKAKSTPKPAK